MKIEFFLNSKVSRHIVVFAFGYKIILNLHPDFHIVFFKWYTSNFAAVLRRLVQVLLALTIAIPLPYYVGVTVCKYWPPRHEPQNILDYYGFGGICMLATVILGVIIYACALYVLYGKSFKPKKRF